MSVGVLKNSRYELFAQAIFNGMTQQDAALNAGYNTKWARSAGCKLATIPNIDARIKELHTQAANKAVTNKVMSVQERQERLTLFSRENLTGLHGTVRHTNIAAIAELNKMTPGVYEPIKVDLSEGLAKLLTELRGNKQLPDGDDNDTENDDTC